MDTAYIAIVAWIPIAVAMFAILRPNRALVLACLIGWLILPRASLEIQGFWDVDKVLATNAGILLGVLLFYPHKFVHYKLTLADVALLLFAAGTCITSVVNGLGAYDGISSFGQQIVRYGVPFFAGRVFIRTREDLYDAARLVTGAAAVYALLAVWEWRMSPNIHKMLYGYFQASFAQHLRWGFHRPIVCFPHALGLGTFFAWAALISIVLWKSGCLRPVWGFSPTCYAFLPVLGVATSMSLGPWGLFLGGLVLLRIWERHHRHWVLLLPMLGAVTWMTARYTNLTDGAWMSNPVRYLSEDRARSLQYRIDAETLLLDRARQQPVFGWGTWGRNRITDERGRDVVLTDGLWIIMLGSFGLVGLVTFYLYWCWPLILSVRARGSPAVDPLAAALLAGIALQSANFVFNGFLSPPLSLLHGGVVTLLATARRTTPFHRPARAGDRRAAAPTPFRYVRALS